MGEGNGGSGLGGVDGGVDGASVDPNGSTLTLPCGQKTKKFM